MVASHRGSLSQPKYAVGSRPTVILRQRISSCPVIGSNSAKEPDGERRSPSNLQPDRDHDFASLILVRLPYSNSTSASSTSMEAPCCIKLTMTVRRCWEWTLEIVPRRPAMAPVFTIAARPMSGFGSG